MPTWNKCFTLAECAALFFYSGVKHSNFLIKAAARIYGLLLLLKIEFLLPRLSRFCGTFW